MQENDQWLEADILPMHSVLNNVYNALIAADIIKCIARKWPMLEANILPLHSVLNNVYNALIAADIIKCIARKWPMIGGWYFAIAFSIK